MSDVGGNGLSFTFVTFLPFLYHGTFFIQVVHSDINFFAFSLFRLKK